MFDDTGGYRVAGMLTTPWADGKEPPGQRGLSDLGESCGAEIDHILLSHDTL